MSQGHADRPPHRLPKPRQMQQGLRHPGSPCRGSWLRPSTCLETPAWHSEVGVASGDPRLLEESFPNDLTPGKWKLRFRCVLPPVTEDRTDAHL